MKEKFKLKARWSREENDILLQYPLGVGTKRDGALLASVFTQEFQRELKDRGYDITTFRFTIGIDFSHPSAKTKFETLIKQHQEELDDVARRYSLVRKTE